MGIKKTLEKVFFSISDILIHLLGSIGFLLCIYFFFHFDSVTDRLLYIGGTVAIIGILAYLIPTKKQ